MLILRQKQRRLNKSESCVRFTLSLLLRIYNLDALFVIYINSKEFCNITH